MHDQAIDQGGPKKPRSPSINHAKQSIPSSTIGVNEARNHGGDIVIDTTTADALPTTIPCAEGRAWEQIQNRYRQAPVTSAISGYGQLIFYF